MLRSYGEVMGVGGSMLILKIIEISNKLIERLSPF